MVNLVQVILVLVITTLTVLLSIVFIQVVYILRDLRETLKRVNKIVDNVETMSAAVVKPVAGFGALIEGLQSSIKIAELLGLVKKGAKKVVRELPEKILPPVKQEATEREELSQREAGFQAHSSDGQVSRVREDREESATRRLFHRGGTPLS